jgi:alkylation response protein AidB-like acyl-CoA dehydrogenase
VTLVTIGPRDQLSQGGSAVDLKFSDEDTLFREEVRGWLRENVPRDARPDEGPEMVAWDGAWQRRQHDGGFAGIAWPREYGGLGLSLVRQLIWYEEYALAGGPYAGSNFVGLNHGGPTLIARGTDEQKSRYLPRILDGSEIWCQGFSEPDAGSDLASLRTKAEIEGDELVVTGQKVWTSYAQVARWQELLVRTSSVGKKHSGITWVICDMASPGIDVRPIKTLNGVKHFAEIFYDSVRIPLANVVGAVDDGWAVAMSTLGFERGTAFMQAQTELARTVERLIEMSRTRRTPDGRALADREDVAVTLATLRAEVAAMRAMTYMGVSRALRIGVPGPSGSLTKLYYADLVQRAYRAAMDLLGADALEVDGQYVYDSWVGRYLLSYTATIGGGTSEVQRNIVAERVLGLPR